MQQLLKGGEEGEDDYTFLLVRLGCCACDSMMESMSWVRVRVSEAPAKQSKVRRSKESLTATTRMAWHFRRPSAGKARLA